MLANLAPMGLWLPALPQTPAAALSHAAGRTCAITMNFNTNDRRGWDNGPFDSNDDDALNELISERGASVAKLGKPYTVMQGLDAAWVLIFNAGREDEGVYTLQGRAVSTSARASAYVLAFERTDDADRFAKLLQRDGFDMAEIYRWNTEQLDGFCNAGDFEVSLVPQGTLITPPTKNEYDVDAFERLQNGEYGSSVGNDPDRRYPGDGISDVDPFAMERNRLEGLLADSEAEGCPPEEGCEYGDEPEAQ
jgi:hypothetical protein